MPAAAVTPAPIAYIKVVAVKKLVVGCLSSAGRRRSESRVHAFALGVVVSKPDSLYGRTTSPEWWSVVRSQSGDRKGVVLRFVRFAKCRLSNPVRAAPPVNRSGCPSPGVSGGRQRLL